MNTLYHDPPLVNCKSYYKKLKERQKIQAQCHSNKVDEILQQSANNIWDNKGDFDDEFSTSNVRTQALNREIKEMVQAKRTAEEEQEEEQEVQEKEKWSRRRRSRRSRGRSKRKSRVCESPAVCCP